MSNDKVTNNLQCEIVKDLLPLYHDDVVSTVTKNAVKDHLDTCKSCEEEYKALCEALPLDNKDQLASKTKYNKMTQKLKIKKILWGLMILGITLTVIGTIAYFLLMVPIVSAGQDNVNVLKAYKFDDEGQDKFLLIYSIPHYTTPSSHKPEITYENGMATIDINLKHTIINPYEKEALEYPWGWNYIFVLEQECSTIKLGDKIIWSEEKDGDTNIPEYVWEFDNEDVCSMGYADDYSTFNFHYNDKRIVYWDLEGNKLYDEYPDENGDYPPFPN